jgi:hypothetical protein
MDVIMADKMDQALLKAAVALLKRCEPQLLQMNDMEDALHLLKLELPGEGCWLLDTLNCVTPCWHGRPHLSSQHIQVHRLLHFAIAAALAQQLLISLTSHCLPM